MAQHYNYDARIAAVSLIAKKVHADRANRASREANNETQDETIDHNGS